MKMSQKESKRKRSKEGQCRCFDLETTVVWCELYQDFTCKSSVAAEAIGMYLQLKRSIGLNYLQLYTDNEKCCCGGSARWVD